MRGRIGADTGHRPMTGNENGDGRTGSVPVRGSQGLCEGRVEQRAGRLNSGCKRGI